MDRILSKKRKVKVDEVKRSTNRAANSMGDDTVPLSMSLKCFFDYQSEVLFNTITFKLYIVIQVKHGLSVSVSVCLFSCSSHSLLIALRILRPPVYLN